MKMLSIERALLHLPGSSKPSALFDQPNSQSEPARVSLGFVVGNQTTAKPFTKIRRKACVGKLIEARYRRNYNHNFSL